MRTENTILTTSERAVPLPALLLLLVCSMLLFQLIPSDIQPNLYRQTYIQIYRQTYSQVYRQTYSQVYHHTVSPPCLEKETSNPVLFLGHYRTTVES